MYAPGTFDRAAIEHGIDGVSRLARERDREAAEISPLVRELLCRGSPNQPFASLAVTGGWQAVAKKLHRPCLLVQLMGRRDSCRQRSMDSLAKFCTVRSIAHAALLALILRHVRGNADPEKAVNFAKRWHTNFESQSMFRLDIDDQIICPRTQLREISYTLRHVGDINRIKFHTQDECIITGAYKMLDIDRFTLPPSIYVLRECLTIALKNGNLDSNESCESAEVLDLLSNAGQVSLGGLQAIWNSLTVKLRIAINSIRRDQINRRMTYPDRRFDLAIVELALSSEFPKSEFWDEYNRCKWREWNASLARKLLDALRDLNGSGSDEAKITGGRPSGRGHEFVVSTFRLYGLPLRQITSGRYLRNRRSR